MKQKKLPQTGAVGARVSVQERNAYPLVGNSLMSSRLLMFSYFSFKINLLDLMQIDLIGWKILKFLPLKDYLQLRIISKG